MGIIRLLLALSVVISHLGAVFGVRIIPGDLAVECFFIISGFYMSLILGDKYQLNRSGILKFYLNRYLRLAPTYWVMILACFGLAFLTGQFYLFKAEPFFNFLGQMSPLSAVFIMFANLFMFGLDILMFLTVRDKSLAWALTYDAGPLPAQKLLFISPAWSLSSELWFYLMAPFLAKRTWKLLAAIVGLSIAIRIGLELNGLYEDPWGNRFFPSEMMYFGSGMLLYRFYRTFNEKFDFKKCQMGLGALLVLMFSYTYIPLDPEFVHYAFAALFAIALPFIFHVTKNSKFDRHVGELSFPLYLCHIVVHQICTTYLRVPSTYQGFVYSALSLFTAYVAYRLVDKPVDRIRQRLAAVKAPSVPGIRRRVA